MSNYPFDDKTLQAALDADVDTLFASIGYIDTTTTMGIAPSDKQSLIALGHSWFESKRDQIRNILCTNKQLHELFFTKDEQKLDIKECVLLISDLIVSLSGGIPVIYISVLIIKIGLREICNDASNNWK